MSATGQRDRVRTLLSQGSTRALVEAERIQSPWYRCQALADVARSAADEDVLHIAGKAFDAARETRDTYQRVAVSSWPIRALLERGKKSEAAKRLVVLLAEAYHIEPPPSKVEALVLLWSAIYDTPSLRQPIQSMLLSTCLTANTWRAGRASVYLVRVIATEDTAKAEAIYKTLPENRYKRQARRFLDTYQAN